MRALTATLIAGLCLATTLACSKPRPPTGRWEGTYESPDTMIVARLEIDRGGAIYVSAPDALDIKTTNEEAREAIRLRLAMGLDHAWADVEPRKFDFDGSVFRKPGHIAPQMKWDADTKQMTLIVYPGTRPTVHVKMHAVHDFSADPWP